MTAYRIRLCLLVGLLLLAPPVSGEDWKGDKLVGHKNHVRATSYSSDGKYLLSGGADNQLLLWDMTTGKQVRSFIAPQNLIVAAVFSPDGRKVVSADHFNRMLHLFDTATGVEEQKFVGHTDLVHGVAYSPNGKLLASASYDLTVRIWDVATGKDTLTLRGHTGHVTSVNFSRDGALLVSASSDGSLILWNVATGTELKRFKGHTAPVIWAEFSPDGRTIASSSDDHTVRLWEVVSGKERIVMNAHNGWARAVAFSPDGRAVASVGQDRKTQIWDPFRAGVVRTYVSHKGVVWSVNWSPDGKRLVTGGDDSLICFTDVGTALEDATPKPAELTEKDLTELWTTLGGADAPKAFQAIGKLLTDPKKSVPFLQEHVNFSVPNLDPKNVAKLIAELDADEYAVRERASAGLAAIGKAIEQDLRQELEKTGSLEVTKRLRTLLGNLAATPSSDVLAVRDRDAGAHRRQGGARGDHKAGEGIGQPTREARGGGESETVGKVTLAAVSRVGTSFNESQAVAGVGTPTPVWP